MQSQSLGSHLVILLLNISAAREFLISIGIMLQTFGAKYLNEFKPKFKVLTVFLKKTVCDVKLYFNTLVGKISPSLLIVQRQSSGCFYGEYGQNYPS